MRFWLCLLAATAVVSVARAAPPIEAYSRLPAIESVTLSPSGERFALVGRDGDNRRLYVRRADGQAEFVANLGAARLRSVAWAGEEHLIVFTSNTVGGGVSDLALQEFSAGIIVDLKTQKTSMIFKGSKTMVEAVFGWFGARQVGGRWYAYVAGVPVQKVRSQMAESQTTTYPDLYRVDVETGAYQLVAKSMAGRTVWALAPDGSVVGHANFDPRGRTQTVYAGPGEDRPLLSRAAGDGKLSLDGLGRTPDSMLFGERGAGEEVAREIRPGGPPGGEVLSTGVEGSDSIRDPVSGLLIGVSRNGGQGEPEFIDPALQRRFAASAKAFPDTRAHLTSLTPGLDRMVIYTEGAKDSGSFWLVDIAKRTAHPIGEARPDIKPADLGAVSTFSYKASDGLALDGVLTLPTNPGGKPAPLIVVPPHGGHSLRESATLDLQAQAFASRGYAVFRPNVRGALGYGEAFRKAADGQVGRKMQTDISDGVAALAAAGVADPKRVCIVGASGYGGYSALAGITLQQGIYRCAVAQGGLSDLPRFVTWIALRVGSDQRRETELKALMGPTEGEDLAAISPTRLAARADAPILLIHDEDNTLIPVEQSRILERALKAAGKPVELVVLPGGDHPLSPEAARQTSFAAALAFVEKNDPAN